MNNTYPKVSDLKYAKACEATTPAPMPPIPQVIQECLNNLEELGSVVNRLESKLTRVLRPYPCCPPDGKAEQSSPGMLGDVEAINSALVCQRNRLQSTIDALMV